MKRKIYFYFLLAISVCCFQLSAFSHPRKAGTGSIAMVPPITIKGKIISEKGEALPGVNISLKGASVNAISDANGNYSIRLPEASGTLVFSYIGFARKEVSVTSKTVIDVTMISDSMSMDEVVVVGYGTQQKRDVTGSISTLKGTEIEKYNVSTFQTAMQGQMAGVEIYESSGNAGAAINVRIRGISSVNGSAGPLYIIDGNPVMTGAAGDGDDFGSNASGYGIETNPLTDINPGDIESIEVLKDASATAIYGARGGSGVILVTTKRGKAGKTNFSFSATSGYTHVGKEIKLLNSTQLLSVLDEAWRNSFYKIPANAGLPLPASPMPGVLGFSRGMADTTNINHLKDVLQTGAFQEMSLSATNGTDKTKYYINGTFRNTKGTSAGSNMNQYNMKVNIDHDLSKYIKIGLSLTPSFNDTKSLGSGSAVSTGGYGAALTANLPIYPTFNPDGTYFNPWNNALAYQDETLYRMPQTRFRLPASFYTDVKFSDNLSWRTMVQREDWNQISHGYISGLLRLRSFGAASSPFADDQLARNQQRNSYGWSNSLQSFFTYKKAIGKNHQIGGTMGMNFQEASQYFEAMYGENYASSNFMYPSQGAYIDNAFQTGAEDDLSANLAYFARADYKFKNRYLLGMVVNREGNSRFGTSRRYGTFPAASVGWIASDESFLAKSKVISFLKFRLSAGLTGNATGIRNQAAKATWQNSTSTAGYQGTPTVNPQLPANAQLHWEKGTKYDAGLDISFLNNRISSTIDVYHYTTTEMLLSIPTPITFGYGASGTTTLWLENRGSMINKGLEFALNSTNFDGAFKWRTNFNISRNMTHIVSIGGLTPQAVSAGGGDVGLFIGQEGPVFNLIEFVGIDPVTGGELIHDEAGNTVLANTLNADQLNNARKPQYDKLPAPTFYGGIGNNFSYKGFDMNVFFSYRVGNYLVDAGERRMSYVGNNSFTNYTTVVVLANLPVSILDRWTKDGDVTNQQKLYYNDAANDVLRLRNTTRFLYDASYIRLKNVQLSYTIPAKVLKRFGVTSARVNLTGQNLLMFTKFKGADPEAQNVTANNYRDRNLGYGLINNALPLAKSFTMGLNVGF